MRLRPGLAPAELSQRRGGHQDRHHIAPRPQVHDEQPVSHRIRSQCHPSKMGREPCSIHQEPRRPVALPENTDRVHNPRRQDRRAYSDPAWPRQCRIRIRSSVLSPWIVYPVSVFRKGNRSAWFLVNAARLSSHFGWVALGSNSVGHRFLIMNLRSWGNMVPVLVSTTPLGQFSRCESRSKSHRKQVIRGSDSAEMIVLETRSAFSDWLAHFRKVRFRVSYSAMASLSTSSSPVAAAGFMVSASRRMSAAIAFANSRIFLMTSLRQRTPSHT